VKRKSPIILNGEVTSSKRTTVEMAN
jgi:hypothetical protein